MRRCFRSSAASSPPTAASPSTRSNCWHRTCPNPGRNKGWTGRTPLPGGDFAIDGFEALVSEIQASAPFLARPHARRLVRAYGTLARSIVVGATAEASLGQAFGATLTAAEVDHLVATEWARTTDDILWRRSKLGLRVDAAQVADLGAYLARTTATLADQPSSLGEVAPVLAARAV